MQAGAGNALVVAAAAADRYHELRRLKPFQGNPVTFTAPVLSHNRLYLRSYAGEVVCLDLTQ